VRPLTASRPPRGVPRASPSGRRVPGPGPRADRRGGRSGPPALGPPPVPFPQARPEVTPRRRARPHPAPVARRTSHRADPAAALRPDPDAWKVALGRNPCALGHATRSFRSPARAARKVGVRPVRHAGPTVAGRWPGRSAWKTTAARERQAGPAVPARSPGPAVSAEATLRARDVPRPAAGRRLDPDPRARAKPVGPAQGVLKPVAGFQVGLGPAAWAEAVGRERGEGMSAVAARWRVAQQRVPASLNEAAPQRRPARERPLLRPRLTSR
jgi:hypothetical protein